MAQTLPRALALSHRPDFTGVPDKSRFSLDWTRNLSHLTRMANNNVSSVALDSQKRAELKGELEQLIRKRHPAIDRGLQFEGVTLLDPDERSLSVLLVLQEIIRENREFSIVQWPGGIALVKTGQVDNLNKDYQAVNEQSNYIIRGGSEKAAGLLDNVAAPTGLSGSQENN
jgi:hypothetical protein